MKPGSCLVSWVPEEGGGAGEGAGLEEPEAEEMLS